MHMITAIFEDLVGAEATAIEDRLDSVRADCVFSATRYEYGIDPACACGVMTAPAGHAGRLPLGSAELRLPRPIDP